MNHEPRSTVESLPVRFFPVIELEHLLIAARFQGDRDGVREEPSDAPLPVHGGKEAAVRPSREICPLPGVRHECFHRRENQRLCTFWLHCE